MAVSVLSAAKFAGEFLGWSVSHLKMQKMLYISHMYHLGRTGGDPLVTGQFEAWDYGPVHPILYHKAKIFGADRVENIFRLNPDIREEEAQTLKHILKVLREFDGAKLVAITHSKNGAWAKHYRPGARGITIPNEDILEEYRRRAKTDERERVDA